MICGSTSHGLTAGRGLAGPRAKMRYIPENIP